MANHFSYKAACTMFIEKSIVYARDDQDERTVYRVEKPFIYK